MTGFGEIGQNGHFWAKMAIFGAKKGNCDFSVGKFVGHFLRPKTEFL